MNIKINLLPSGKKIVQKLKSSQVYNKNIVFQKWKSEVEEHLNIFKKNTPVTSYGYQFHNIIEKSNSLKIKESKIATKRGIETEKKAYRMLKNKFRNRYKILKGPDLFVYSDGKWHETDLIATKNNYCKAIIEVKYDAGSIPKAMRQLDIRMPKGKTIKIKKRNKIRKLKLKRTEKWIVTNKPDTKNFIILESGLWHKRSIQIVYKKERILNKKQLLNLHKKLRSSIPDEKKYVFFWMEEQSMVEKLFDHSGVVVFGKNGCQYSEKVWGARSGSKHRMKYNEKNPKFNKKWIWVSVKTGDSIHQEVIKKTGHRTFPAVWKNGKFVGGCDDYFRKYPQSGGGKKKRSSFKKISKMIGTLFKK